MVPLKVFSPFAKRATTTLLLVLTFHPRKTAYADEFHYEDEMCLIGPSVDLTYAVANTSGYLDASGRFFPREIAKFSDGAWRGCVCDLKPCLAVCPRPNTTTTIRINDLADGYANYSDIPRVYTTSLTLEDDEETLGPEERFHFVIGDKCRGKNAYLLDPGRYKSDEYYLLKNGSLFLPRRIDAGKRLLDVQHYCLRQKGNNSRLVPRVCVPKVVKDDFAAAKYIGALVAVPFLLATVIVYTVLHELRNIHGTTLRCYLCCLIVTYVTLAADRIPPPDFTAGGYCLFLGFTIYFSFLASFLWLNVMCIDMWWRIGGFGSLRSSGAHHDRKKLIAYSIYAWGSAVVMTAICICMEFAPGLPASIIRPGFKMQACWFSTKTAAALYFFGPVGIIIACNICLFISTTIKLVRHKRDTQRQLNTADSRRHDDDKQWFSLHLKLSVIMGITWSTEVISWLWEGPKYLWYITDMVNALQGFLIFIIFVWKKRIWKSLKKRYNELQVTKHGCFFITLNSDSPPTTNCSDDSTVRCNVSVLAMEERKNTETQNPTRNTTDRGSSDSR